MRPPASECAPMPADNQFTRQTSLPTDKRRTGLQIHVRAQTIGALVLATACGTPATAPPVPNMPNPTAESPTSHEDQGSSDQGSSLPSSPHSDSACLSGEANASWQATLDTLKALEELLPTFTPGTPPVACVTDVWAAAEPAARAVETSLQADFDRNERARWVRWREALPSNAVWFRVFVPGVSRAPVGGRIVTFDTVPALTARVSRSGPAQLQQPQHCLVLAADIERDVTALRCGEPDTASEGAAFTVAIGDPFVRAQLPTLARGDVVRFDGYLSLVGEVPQGQDHVTQWHFYDVQASSVQITARSTCCPR